MFCFFQEEITEEIGIHPVNSIPNTPFRRTSDFLTHPVFNRYCQDCSDTEIRNKAFRNWSFWLLTFCKSLASFIIQQLGVKDEV